MPFKVKNLTPPANGKNSPAPGRQQQQKRPGTTDAQRAAARPFLFLPALPGRSHCTTCSSQRPPRTPAAASTPRRPAAYHASAPPALCQHTADRRAILHRLHTASPKAASTPAPCRACPMTPRPACFGADRWPDDPARLPDRRCAGAARPAAPPLAIDPRPPPGAGPMTTARPPPRP